MSQIQQLKDANNIIEVIGERLALKQAGASFKGLCPFHNEKTPSFFVNEQLQRYKCFGCGVSGDVIEFLQQYEAMSFYEALKYLADQAGIQLKDYQRSQDDHLREQLLTILNLAQEYYHFLLTKHPTGQPGRNYLKKRGVSQQSIKLFKLGYALPDWDGLIKYLYQKKKFSLDDLLKTGLVIRSSKGRFYDRFRARIMFPLKNHRGQVVGFSGRLLQQQAKQAKYINTPETLLYHKSQLLYGYKELLQQLKKQGEVIVAEGEFDVISSDQAHVSHIVAIKGSALTEQQAKLLARVVKQVSLCLDTDEAGIAATKRAIKVINQTQLELKVIDLSQVKVQGQSVKDVDELARQDPKLWRETAKQAVAVYQFLLDVALKNHNANTAEGKKRILQDLAVVFNQIPHEVEKDFYVSKLAQAINVKKDLVKQDLRTISEKQQVKSRSQKHSQLVAESEQPSRLQELAHYLLFLLLRSQGYKVKNRAQQLVEFDLDVLGANQVIKSLVEFKPDFELKKFAQSLPEDLKEQLFNWYLQPKYLAMLESLDLNQEWLKAYQEFRKLMIQQQIAQLNKQIQALDSQLNKTQAVEQQITELMQQIVERQQQLKEL
ncbi:MAG: DNA primase [Candidatus Pacebacteria bacterium]|nr:DNA primase [Candidatus Paceibacterota bacterium]